MQETVCFLNQGGKSIKTTHQLFICSKSPIKYQENLKQKNGKIWAFYEDIKQKTWFK